MRTARFRTQGRQRTGPLDRTPGTPRTSASATCIKFWSSPIKHEFKDISQKNDCCFDSENSS